MDERGDDREDSGYTGEEDHSLEQYDMKTSSPTTPEGIRIPTPAKLENGHLKEKEASQCPHVLQKKCCCELKMIHYLWLVVLAVWVLLSLPVIFYHIPSDSEMRDDVGNSSNMSSNCLSSVPYPTPGGICQTALHGLLLSRNCDSNDIPLVLHNEEKTASEYLSSLELLGPSDECREAVTPFLCLHLFGLCDSSGVSLQPTSGQCEEIRDRVCRTEWAIASRIVDLPMCAIFPPDQAACPNQNESVSSGSGMDIFTVPASSFDGPTDKPLDCREGFYREEPGGNCLPSCYTWLQNPKAVSITIDVVLFITAFVGFWAAVAVIVISLLRRKRMFTFPSVFVVYKTVDLVVLAFFVMVNYTDRGSLFCASKNIILKSQLKVTPFCVISGMVFTYTLIQLTVWWLFHTASLFWKIQFPFHARSFEASGRIKYIHISCFIAGILIPLVPIIASAAKSATNSSDMRSFLDRGLGFSVTRFPPVLCTGSDKDVVFYSVVMPINLVLAVGCSLLIIMFWTIHKQHGLFSSKNTKSSMKIGAAERKLLIVFCYYVLLAVISLSAFTLATKNLPKTVRLFAEYFNCERNGHNTSDPCSRLEFERLNNATLASFAYILLGLFPIVNLIYAVNIQELKVYCRCFKKKTASRISNNELSTVSSAVNSFTLKRETATFGNITQNAVLR